MQLAFKDLQISILDRIAHGDNSTDILALICQNFEAEVPDSIAGVTILDRSTKTFEPGIFPSLSASYGDALAGINVADKPGSCALAVADGKIVDCVDVATDPRFTALWRDLSLAHGLEALSSFPACQRDGLALGTFVVAYPAKTGLGQAARVLAEDYAALCGKVLVYRWQQFAQELVVGELQHRNRNLFSTIGVVVYSTLKSNPSPDAFRKVLDGRLAAMARAQSLAMGADSCDLRHLLAETLAPYSLDRHVTIKGPPIRLSRESATAFCLGTHELATNAAKFGALSREGGALDIAWSYPDAQRGQFNFTWIESQGPEVHPPTRQGFGQRTLRAGFSSIDGLVELEYPPQGFRFSLSAPQSQRLGTLVEA